MSEQCMDALRCEPEDLRQAMSIHTRKITDACRDKDCIEDLRVWLTGPSQKILDCAAGVKVRSARLMHTYIDVEPVAFDRNHYCIDVTFYYQILADAMTGSAVPASLCGLAVFSKRAVLCGEDSRAHIFTSDTCIGGADGATLRAANRPTAVVEVLDPMVLGSRVAEGCETKECAMAQIPGCIQNLFGNELMTGPAQRRLFVTLGQFSIIRLERDAQLIVPVLDYALPTKSAATPRRRGEDPCEMFSRIPFPTKQFTPTGCDQKDCRCD